jgi:hypothetical protein
LDFLDDAVEEDRRELGDDCIAVTADAHHSGGYAINQRAKAGFKTPRFPVAAGDDDEV